MSGSSICTLQSPRKRNWRKPRACLMRPWTGSVIAFRTRVDGSPGFGLQFFPHRGVQGVPGASPGINAPTVMARAPGGHVRVDPALGYSGEVALLQYPAQAHKPTG